MTRNPISERWIPLQSRPDRSVLYGGLLAGSLVLIGMLMTGSMLRFLDPGSLLIVLGGTLGATMIHCSIADLQDTWRAIRQLSQSSAPSLSERMQFILKLSHAVKRDGLLALDREAAMTRDPFLKLALELASDATRPDELRRILELEMRTDHERSERAVQVLETMGQYAPALGLIGTIIGLIQMLSALNDTAAIGPAMALALVTTFYGATIANLVCLPLAGRLRNLQKAQAAVKAVVSEGVASLAAQENPVVLEQRFRSFRAAVG